MKKSEIQIHNEHLLSRARVALRAFTLNTLFVLLIWLFSFIPGFLFFGALVTGVPGAWFYYLMVCALALWEMIAVIFFLVPGLAYLWEYKVGEN